MNRTAARELAVRLCFALSENPSDPGEFLRRAFDDEYYETLSGEDRLYAKKPAKKQLDYITCVVTGVYENAPELDGYIQKYAVGWKYDRISKTAATIMKIAMFEVLYMPDVPDNAAINEAVELSKKYETPETRSFINGILGSFYRSECCGGKSGHGGSENEAGQTTCETGSAERGQNV